MFCYWFLLFINDTHSHTRTYIRTYTYTCINYNERKYFKTHPRMSKHTNVRLYLHRYYGPNFFTLLLSKQLLDCFIVSPTLFQVSNTYYVADSQKHIPDVSEARQVIGYYQWVPLILLCQALFFYVPRLFWKFFSSNTALDLAGITSTICQAQYVSGLEARDVSLRQAAKHFDTFLTPMSSVKAKQGRLGRVYQFMSKYGLCIFGQLSGNYVSAVYIFVKILYLTNVICQLFALNYFLGASFHMFGYEAVVKLITSGEVSFSDR